MTILYIYIGSIVLTISVLNLIDKYEDKEMENRGYEYADKNKNIYGKIIDNIKEFLVCCIPCINLIFAMYAFFNSEKITNELIEDFIADGTIIKIEEKQEPKLIEAVEIDNNKIENSKVVVYRVENNEKKQLTREEKIEFLKQEYSRLTNTELDSKSKSKVKHKRR